MLHFLKTVSAFSSFIDWIVGLLKKIVYYTRVPVMLRVHTFRQFFVFFLFLNCFY